MAQLIYVNRIKDLRKENDLTIKKLSEKVGIPQSTLSQYENGKRAMNIGPLKKLSEFFEVSDSFLLGLTDDKSLDIEALEKGKLAERLAKKAKEIERKNNKAASTEFYKSLGDITNTIENIIKTRGNPLSLEQIEQDFKEGKISKDEYSDTLKYYKEFEFMENKQKEMDKKIDTLRSSLNNSDIKKWVEYGEMLLKLSSK